MQKIIGGALLSMGLVLMGAAPSAGQIMKPAAATHLATTNSMIQLAQGAQRFEFPRSHGASVDWCAVWANGCGWEGAHQFCRRRGFARATGWDVFQPGHTYVIGDGRYCNGDFCKGFRDVTCSY
jgi:hypothetical protein